MRPLLDRYINVPEQNSDLQALKNGFFFGPLIQKIREFTWFPAYANGEFPFKSVHLNRPQAYIMFGKSWTLCGVHVTHTFYVPN
jgi:hypothetical protein